MKKSLQLISLIYALFILTSCSGVYIETIKKLPYDGKLNRIFVVFRTREMTGDFGSNLMKAIKKELSARKIESDYYIQDPSNKDSNKETADKINSFQTDVVLKIFPNALGYGNLTNAGGLYEIGLYRTKDDFQIWRATLEVGAGLLADKNQVTGAFTNKLISQLEIDGIIQK